MNMLYWEVPNIIKVSAWILYIKPWPIERELHSLEDHVSCFRMIVMFVQAIRCRVCFYISDLYTTGTEAI